MCVYFGCAWSRHVFGVKANVSNALHYADDSCVVYPAGHNVVKFTPDTKLQEILNGSESSSAISCLAVSPSRRYELALLLARVGRVWVAAFTAFNTFII